MRIIRTGISWSPYLNEVLSIRAQEYGYGSNSMPVLFHLNEVLSIRAQESCFSPGPHPKHPHLNEVLSIRAQECALYEWGPTYRLPQ